MKDDWKARSVMYEVHWAGHEALALSRQVVRMTIDAFHRKGPRSRGMRAMVRDADKIIAAAERIKHHALLGLELRTSALTPPPSNRPHAETEGDE